MCIKLVNYWDKFTEMHGQQNVKILIFVYMLILREGQKSETWEHNKNNALSAIKELSIEIRFM